MDDFLVHNRLNVLVDHRLVMLMNYLLLVLMDDILVVLVNDFLVLLLDLSGEDVFLNNSSFFVLLHKSTLGILSELNSFVMLDDNRLSVEGLIDDNFLVSVR